MRYKQPREYLARMSPHLADADSVMEQHEVGREDRVFEFMMNALRLTEGFSTRTFLERTGIPVMRIQHQLDEAEQRELITRDQMRIAPTLAGRRFLNDLLQIFLPDSQKATGNNS
jgi:oxygen-independent coproporphyrinogen-3 oxidase